MIDRLFAGFEDNARLWVYVADRALTSTEAAQLNTQLDSFFSSWQSHGRPVQGAAELLGNRLLLVTAQLAKGDISGCGIDASVHALDAIAPTLGIKWMSGLMVVYRDAEGGIEVVRRPAFRKMLRAGEVDAETLVLNTGLMYLHELRAGALEQPAWTAWTGLVFRIAPPEAVAG